MTFRRLFMRSALAAGLAAALAAPAAAQQAPVVLKFHTFMSPQSNVWRDMHMAWMDKVEKESNGRIKFERYPAMQLGGTPLNLYDQAKDGVVDVVWTLVGNTPGRMPRTEVFELPFMMTNAEATSRAMWEYVQTNARDEFKDVQLLATHVHGPGVIHTKDKPVKSINDLKGMKVRGPTRLITSMLKSVGATPVGMPLPQIPDALSKGVIDGAVIPWEVVPAVKVNELTKYHAEFDPKLPALYTTTFVLAMNKAKYDALPPDVKKVIDELAEEMPLWTGKYHDQENVGAAIEWAKKDHKLDVLALSPQEKAAWDAKLAPMVDAWIAEAKAKGLPADRYIARARELRDQFAASKK
jgi:TRAP-type C4-dicarboxylate transport system substrate-binding protein